MTQSKAWGYEYRSTTICIDSYEDNIPVGRMYNLYKEAGNSFNSLTQLLLKIEDMLDEMKFPQAFTAVRTFSPGLKLDTGPPGLAFREGRLATFSLKILFRQNASWQGTILWLDTGREQPFRSALELIFLINSALTEAKEEAS